MVKLGNTLDFRQRECSNEKDNVLLVVGAPNQGVGSLGIEPSPFVNVIIDLTTNWMNVNSRLAIQCITPRATHMVRIHIYVEKAICGYKFQQNSALYHHFHDYFRTFSDVAYDRAVEI